MASISQDRPLSLQATRRQRLLSKTIRYHEKLPGINKLPLSVLGVIGLLIVVNIVVWIAVGIVLVSLLSSLICYQI
jgi:hypothetical protein